MKNFYLYFPNTRLRFSVERRKRWRGEVCPHLLHHVLETIIDEFGKLPSIEWQFLKLLWPISYNILMFSHPSFFTTYHSQYHNWRRHISHCYLNCQVPKVSSEELLLSRPIRCELSRLRCHGHSLLLSSYLHRISRKENSACSACGHPLQDLNHLLLDCPASEPLRKSIFGSSLSILDLWSRSWGVARLLGLRGVPPRPHLSEGVG